VTHAGEAPRTGRGGARATQADDAARRAGTFR
jgi:hypothetical protein